MRAALSPVPAKTARSANSNWPAKVRSFWTNSEPCRGTCRSSCSVSRIQGIRSPGSNKKVPFKARVIAATNENLSNSMQNGSFRSDLYYRLNVININIPPLRERIEDLPVLCSMLSLRRKGCTISPSCICHRKPWIC